MQSMKHQEVRNLESIPVGSLGLVALPGYREMVEKVDEYLIRWRTERENEHKNSLAFAGYIRPSYIVGSEVPRFGTGEGKGMVSQSVRGYDIYIISDVTAYQEEMRTAATQEDAQGALNGLISSLFVRAQQGWLGQHMDADLNAAIQKFAKALKSYRQDGIALSVALERAGFDAQPAEMNTALSYAADQIVEAENRNANISDTEALERDVKMVIDFHAVFQHGGHIDHNILIVEYRALEKKPHTETTSNSPGG